MYKGAERIFIRHSRKEMLDNLVKQIPGAKWSGTYGAWYFPLNERSYKYLLERLGNVAKFNTDHLRAYLLKRQAVKASVIPAAEIPGASRERDTPVAIAIPSAPEPTVSYK